MTTFQGTTTYLIECSRENSAININDDNDTNGSWSNETDFVIKRGDRISVEMVCANIRGSGTSAPTIEFSGQNVVVNGETKPYCDTKVLLEVFFYMNNNNTYSVGLPLIHPFGGINGAGAHGGQFENLVTPFNLNPRLPPNNVTNQATNYREINMGKGYIYPDSDGWNTEWETYGARCYFNSQEFPPGTPVTEPFGWAYGIYQFQIENPVGTFVWQAPDVGFTQGQVGRVSAIRVKPNAIVTQTQTTPPTYFPNLYTDYNNGILGGRTGENYQNVFYKGNHIFIGNNDVPSGTPEVDWLGTINEVYGTSGLGAPVFNVAVLEITLLDTNTFAGSGDLQYSRKFDYECGDIACYVGGLYNDNPNPAVGFVQTKLDVKAGSSQEGLINYDNLDLSTIPLVAGKYKGRGFMRGNNALFMYSRNTRMPQLGQNANLALFPNTEFNPVGLPADKVYTADAGEYGDKPLGSQFGYRNANIQQENNNDPYIFMRNDHFGSGRLGQNAQEMPLAEPMTAFIYVTLKELLQDVNSVTAVINQRLNETITGIGTNIQQTSKLLLNSLENPEQRKSASNVIPFYNKVGFYDTEVTEPIAPAIPQNVLMVHSQNAQFRNIITDIIPIKNGGCVKVNPANFTSGRNYLAQSIGKQWNGIPGLNSDAPQESLDNCKETTYLREIETSSGDVVSGVEPVTGNPTETTKLTEINYEGWANPIYGNFASANLYKYQLGDRWSRLPVYDCDSIAWTGGGINAIQRQVGKCIILNNKLTYEVLDFKTPEETNDYTGSLAPFPLSKPKDLICNRLYENQLIYLNIPFPSLGLEENDTAEETIIRQKWTDFAKAMRNYETYYNVSNTAPVTYKQQILDIANWIFDGDVGMTDDRTTSQLRTFKGAPSNDPPLTAPDLTPTAPPTPIVPVPFAEYQQNRPFNYDWTAYPTPSANTGVNGTALGVVPNDFRPAIYTPNRTLICPTTTHEAFAGISATSNIDEDEKYRMLKELGRLKMKSRFQAKFVDIALNFVGANIKGITPPTLTDINDSAFLVANDPLDPDYKVDTTFMESLDLGFYPYTYDLEYGTINLCAIMVGTDYEPNVNKLSTINFGSMCWGNSIGISNSFFDNHGICPMNNDQVKRGQPLTDTTSSAGKWTQIGYQDTLAVETNIAYQAPLADATAYTQTTGIGAQQATIWDFTTNFLVAPYINPAPGAVGGRFRFKMECTGGLAYNGSSTIIWEQTSLLNVNNPVPTDYKFISSTDPDWTDPSNPAYGIFNGLYLNPNLNGTDNTWVLTSGSGVQPFVTAFQNLGMGMFQVQGLGEPGAYFLGDYESGFSPPQMWLFDTCTLSVYEFPVVSPGTEVIEPNLGLEYNKVNYVWCGSSQPKFQYDPTKGRVEFAQLQEDNILNQKSVPYSTATTNPAQSTGTKAGIINTATEDAVFSRNTDTDNFISNVSSKPVKNAGIRAEISGVGIYKVWLCPESYEPPNNINLASYWDNSASGETIAGGNEIDYWGQTELNRAKITNKCVEASEKNWVGSLFERLGFQSHRELLPAYGNQQNRFNPTTYNQTRPDKISRGTKPLILCNAVDNSIDPALNTFFTADASGTALNGIPMYSNGFLNDESVSLALVNQSLTASAPPILSTSPFLLIESDICSTNYRSGRTQQNVLFYLMKNYQASSFIYGYGSSYSHTANQDRMLSLVNTSLRDPITGRLQKCSNNSTIIYKIQRDITILPPTTDALGNPLPEAQPAESSTDKLLSQIVKNTDKAGKTGGGGIGMGVGMGVKVGDAERQASLDQALLGQILEGAGQNLDFVEGPQVAQMLEATLTEINNNPNISPSDAEVQKAVAFTIARLLETFPLELTRDPLSGIIGMANPASNQLDTEIGGELMDSTDGGLSAKSLSSNVIDYLATKLNELGGITAITQLMTNLDDGESATATTEALQAMVNAIVINPLTGEQIGTYGEYTGNMNEVGMLGFRETGSTSFPAITSAMTQYLINENNMNEMRSFREPLSTEEDRQDILLDQATAVLTQSILAGGRVSLADPAGEWVTQFIFDGPIQGMSQERFEQLREVPFIPIDPDFLKMQPMTNTRVQQRKVERNYDEPFETKESIEEYEEQKRLHHIEMGQQAEEKTRTPPASPRQTERFTRDGGERKEYTKDSSTQPDGRPKFTIRKKEE